MDYDRPKECWGCNESSYPVVSKLVAGLCCRCAIDKKLLCDTKFCAGFKQFDDRLIDQMQQCGSSAPAGTCKSCSAATGSKLCMGCLTIFSQSIELVYDKFCRSCISRFSLRCDVTDCNGMKQLTFDQQKQIACSPMVDSPHGFCDSCGSTDWKKCHRCGLASLEITDHVDSFGTDDLFRDSIGRITCIACFSTSRSIFRGKAGKRKCILPS